MQLNAMGMQLPYTLFHKGCYVIPRPDGTLVIGATMEHGITDLQTTDAGNLSVECDCGTFYTWSFPPSCYEQMGRSTSKNG